MTQTISSRSGLQALIQSSASPKTVRSVRPTADVGATTTGKAALYVFEASVVHAPQRPGWRDINEVVAEREKNPKRAAALVRARQRLAAEDGRRTLSVMRLEKGLSQAQLAKMIDTSQSRLSRIEAGLDDPLHSTVRKLALALGHSVTTISDALDSKGEGK